MFYFVKMLCQRFHDQYLYYILQQVFVDVVKYKLDRMRQKIENKERDSTCKTLFKCPHCHKEYNEFDAGNLMDMLTGLMNCTFCGSEVRAK